MITPAVAFHQVTRAFGDLKAVDEVDLAISDGEFFTLLGPSGSGKTTCLRMIAGFDRPTSGTIFLHGRDVTALPPYEREVNTVFQDYALFPHMSVGDNIGYGLMIRNVPRAKRAERVGVMLDLVRLPGLARRKPAQLSGGQRQRVALARALINQPRILLLDEPLGALDLKLRQEMQSELKSLQQRLGITFVYVTHDQEEALGMSDRLAVFNHGRIEQVGTPAEVYERPATEFVAGFVGTSNLLEGETARTITGASGRFALRPEKIHLGPADAPLLADSYCVDGVVKDVVYLGLYTRYVVTLEGGSELLVVQQNLATSSTDVAAVRGQRVRMQWLRQHLLALG
jgi:putative spermidine/putrescine transport system ATP-binding protein